MANNKPTNGDTMRASALARKLNTIMTERKLSRAAFARKAGISEATLSRMLAGKANPHDSTLRWMEDQLGLPNMYFSTNIKNPVTDEDQCILESKPKPKAETSKSKPEPAKAPKRLILSWKSVSGEEEETEILANPTVCFNGEVKAPIKNGRISLFCDKLIWWTVEEV